jgi:hypothetical protein
VYLGYLNLLSHQHLLSLTFYCISDRAPNEEYGLQLFPHNRGLSSLYNHSVVMKKHCNLMSFHLSALIFLILFWSSENEIVANDKGLGI